MQKYEKITEYTIMNSKLLAMATGVMLAACSATAATDIYKISAAMPEELEGLTAYLVNFDTGEKMDSAMVAGNMAVFNGTMDGPALAARIIVDGHRLGDFILEPGEISVARRMATGTPLNQKNLEIMAYVRKQMERYNALPDDSTSHAARKALLAEYNAYMDSVFRANADNPIGYTVFLTQAEGRTYDQLKAIIEKYPVLDRYQRVNKLFKDAECKALTSPGHKFRDFTIVNDSVKQSLSDYVGKGKPVLVDFWASWCGPCIRETKVIKELLEEYGPQGLEVLGVAVWDEPKNTLAAIKTHQLPWPQIINAQKVPTDLYGISGIPCILIIGPDGTILSRDKQDAALKADVKAVMEGALTSASFVAPSAPAASDSVPATK